MTDMTFQLFQFRLILEKQVRWSLFVKYVNFI